MSLNKIFEGFNKGKKHKTPKCNKKIEILNSEGTILMAEKVDEEFYFNFKHDKHRMLISKENIKKFLKGELVIKIPSGKVFDISEYVSCICFMEEEMINFLH